MRLLGFLISTALLSAAPTPLFNGKNLQGWIHEGPRATFSAQNGELITSGDGNAPNWLHTAKEHENFRLSFDYKLEQWAEAAVIVRAPRLGRPARAGVALTLAHDFHKDNTPYVTGGIQGALPPNKLQPVEFGKWHSVTLELNGERLKAAIDGDVVQNVDMSEVPALRWGIRGKVNAIPG